MKRKKHRKSIPSVASANPGMRSLLRHRAHALMEKVGMRKVNREARDYHLNCRVPSYFAQHWREWAMKPWPQK